MNKIYTIIAAIGLATTAHARDNIQIAGSSTVLPYASIVAEAFGENTDYPTPVVESGGSGAGQKKLCLGIGTNTIDIANSSSLMTEETWAKCEKTIGKVAEVRIGYDGIVFAATLGNRGFDNMSQEEIFHAVRADSPYTMWNEINPDLPAEKITVYLPGTKHGTREVFEKKVMVVGCKAAGLYDTLGKKGCMAVRRDGLSVDIDGDYTETLARMASNPTGIGVFGLSFLTNNTDKIYAANINGAAASVETIVSGEYPISRPLQFYVKTAHLATIPGLRDYIEFFVSDEIAGPNGPLATYGLVPDPELSATRAMVEGL